MKRLVTMFLIFCLFLCGCSSATSNPPNKKTDSSGNDIRSSLSGIETIVNIFPCPVQYNDSIFYLESVDFYESYSEDSFSYFLYCIVTFDVSNLTDSEIHWLTTEDINVSVSYNSADEGYDFVNMPKIGVLHIPDTQKLVYSFAPSNFSSYRHSFAKKDIVLLAKVQQEEMYEIKEGLKANKEHMVSYVSTISETLPDSDLIPEPIYSYMVECIKKSNRFIESLY